MVGRVPCTVSRTWCIVLSAYGIRNEITAGQQAGADSVAQSITLLLLLTTNNSQARCSSHGKHMSTKSATERTKVVVRNLPPTLAKEAFVSTIDKHVEGAYNWLAYYSGKVRLASSIV